MWLSSISTSKAELENILWQKTNNLQSFLSSVAMITVHVASAAPATYGFPLELKLRVPSFFSKEALMSYVQFALKNQSESQAGWTSPQMKNTNWWITISLRILTLTLLIRASKCACYDGIQLYKCVFVLSMWPLRYIIIQPSCLTETKTFCPKNIFIAKQ